MKLICSYLYFVGTLWAIHLEISIRGYTFNYVYCEVNMDCGSRRDELDF